MRLIDKYKLPELFWSTVPAMAHLAFEEFGSHSRLIEFEVCFSIKILFIAPAKLTWLGNDMAYLLQIY